MEEMKNERDKLIELFDKDTDLKEKIIISGVKQVYFILILIIQEDLCPRNDKVSLDQIELIRRGQFTS